MNHPSVINHIVDWLKSYAESSHTEGFVVGVSGGIDSALTSTLCALTGKKTLLLEMPIHQAASQVSRAQEHITWLKNSYPQVTDARVDLTPAYDSFMQSMAHQASDEHTQHLTMANTRARLRMTTLYYHAGVHRLLVAGTGNKVEDFGVGFFTKYGDGGVDISPIADLMKTEVYELAAHLGVAQSILLAAPTDGLWGDDRSDEDQIGASYPELEWAMRYLEQPSTNQEILSERQQEVLAIYTRMHKANQHKMLPIPVCEIGDRL
ncbi:MAG: NAD(+) synthase [Flavobacteriales bacterium]